MKLPNSEKVFISRDKLLNYILSETHLTGKFKAKYFRNLGFNERNVHLLEKALRMIAKTQDVKEFSSSLYGIKYIVDGKIDTPKGKSVVIRTIWITEHNQNRPSFVTTYPAKKVL